MLFLICYIFLNYEDLKYLYQKYQKYLLPPPFGTTLFQDHSGILLLLDTLIFFCLKCVDLVTRLELCAGRQTDYNTKTSQHSPPTTTASTLLAIVVESRNYSSPAQLVCRCLHLLLRHQYIIVVINIKNKSRNSCSCSPYCRDYTEYTELKLKL